MREWLLLSRGKSGNSLDWSGTLQGANGLEAWKDFSELAISTSTVALFLVQLSTEPARPILCTWKDPDLQHLTDGCIAGICKLVEEVCTMKGRVFLSGWVREENWENAFSDYHQWLLEKQKGQQ